MIDRLISNIEKSFNKNNIQLAFQLINELKIKYPQSTRVEDLFKKNKLKYIQRMKINSIEIENLYLNKNHNDSKMKLDKFLKIEPNNAYLNSCMGNYYGQIGQLKQARIYHEKSILSNPYERTFYINFAETCKFLGILDLSEKFYQFSLLLDDADETVLSSHADVCFMRCEFKKSFQSYEKLVFLEKKNKETIYKKKYCHKLIISNNLEKAKEILNELTEEKDKIDVFYYNALIKIEEKQYNKALEFLDECFKINKNFIVGYIALAIILERQGQFKEAINNLKKVINIEKNNDLALRNLGVIYSHIGKLDEAAIFLKRTIKINPNDYETKFILGQIQLYQKNFADGWKNYESRWLCNNFKGKKFLSSKKELKNLEYINKVLVWSEQGIGDQIMYGSIFSEFSKICNKLIIRIDKRLIRLFENKNSNVTFVGENYQVKEDDYDSHLSIVDLGKFFRTNIHQFETTKFPYIDVDNKLSIKIRDNYYNPKKIIVGISWSSKNEDMGKDKSIHLKNLIPILNLEKLTFLDLEYMNSESDKLKICEMLDIKLHKINDIDYFNDIFSVASIINACDIIITCSNLNAHIAGALGKKTFLLLSLGKGRLLNWSSENKDSIWYPSVSVFQQEKFNDWKTPINKIKKELLKFIKNK